MKNEEKIFESLSMLPDDIINEACPEEDAVRVVKRKSSRFIRAVSAAAAVLLACGISYRFIIEPLIGEMQIRSMMQAGVTNLSDSEDFSESDMKVLNLFDYHKYTLDRSISEVLDSFTRDDLLYILSDTGETAVNVSVGETAFTLGADYEMLRDSYDMRRADICSFNDDFFYLLGTGKIICYRNYKTVPEKYSELKIKKDWGYTLIGTDNSGNLYMTKFRLDEMTDEQRFSVVKYSPEMKLIKEYESEKFIFRDNLIFKVRDFDEMYTENGELYAVRGTEKYHISMDDFGAADNCTVIADEKTGETEYRSGDFCTVTCPVLCPDTNSDGEIYTKNAGNGVIIKLKQSQKTCRKVWVYDTHGIKMKEITGFMQSRPENSFEKILPYKDNSVIYLNSYGNGDSRYENNLNVSDSCGNSYVIDLYEKHGKNIIPDNYVIKSAASDSSGACYVLYDAVRTVVKSSDRVKLYSAVLKFDISDPEGSRKIIFLPDEYSSGNMICVKDRIFVSAFLSSTDGYAGMYNERSRLYEADFSEGRLNKTAAYLKDGCEIVLSDQGYALYNGKIFDLINNCMKDSGEMTTAEICSLNFQKAGDSFTVIPEGTDIFGKCRYITLTPKN